MAYSSIRDWLADVDRDGELKRISGAGTDLEMAGIAQLVQRHGRQPPPAMLFDRIPGFPDSYGVLFGILSSPRRLARALYLPPGDRLQLLKNWRTKVTGLRLIPPVFVSDGVVMENRLVGTDVDLTKFPSPRCHELDGGPYFGTAHAVIMRDRETGYINLGTYRCMLVDHNRLALHMLPGSHGRTIYNRYIDSKENMPIAIAIGTDPTLSFVSGYRVPWGVSEYDYAGGIREQPITVLKGEFTGLPLPATAELIIEGECRPGVLLNEGPFGEWHGYYANQGLESVLEPGIEVKAIYYRNNPILTCSCPSIPPGPTSLPSSLDRSATVWNALEAAGIPGVEGVWAPEEAGSQLMTVVALRQTYAGQSRQAGEIAMKAAGSLGGYTVMVDDDIDVTDLRQVAWAIATRSDPEHSIHVFSHCDTNSADPVVPLAAKRAGGPLYRSRAVIDACRPFETKAEWYPVADVSRELRDAITSRWCTELKDIS